MALPSSSSSHIIAMFNKIFHPRFFTSHSLAAPATKHKTLYDLSHANVSRMPNTFHSYPPSSVSEWKNIYDVRININRPHSPLSRNLWAFFPKRKCFRMKRFTADSHDMIPFESMISSERKPYQRPRGMSCGSRKTSRVNNSIPFPSMSVKSIAESLFQSNYFAFGFEMWSGEESSA